MKQQANIDNSFLKHLNYNKVQKIVRMKSEEILNPLICFNFYQFT